MDLPSRQALLLASGAVLGYAVVMLGNPARVSLRHGLRCLRRYQRIWLIPAGFALAHASFEFCLHLRATSEAGGAVTATALWDDRQVTGWTDALAASGLSIAESTLAIFNCIVNTFPVSALGALAFLCNWRHCQGIVWRGLQRRCGVIGGFAVHFFVVICALAALGKPVAFYLLADTNLPLEKTTMMRGGELLNALSFFFEYLLGVGVQIYLLLLAFVWVRGLSFNFPELRRLALRRFTVVVRWAAVVLLVSGLGINLPLILLNFDPQLSAQSAFRCIMMTRWILTGVLLISCAIQVLLTLHHSTLRDALRESVRLWRLHHWQVGWLLGVAALHFSLLAIVNAVVPQVFGRWTLPANTWNLLGYPLLWSALAGWFLASWVCLFRRCEGQRLELIEPVRFSG